jgi:hypothetical protein
MRLQLNGVPRSIAFRIRNKVGISVAQLKLPRRVEYLQVVIDQLAQVPRSELNEDTDISLLESVVKQRLGNLSNAEAKKTLRADRKALANWLRKSGNEDSPAYFILAWMMAGAPALLGVEDPVTSITEMLEDLPPASPGRAFGPLPHIERVQSDLLAEDGNFFLYVSNSSSEPPAVDIRVTLDGQVIVNDSFEQDLYSKFTRYRLRLSPGTHRIAAVSERGQASLEETITVVGQLHVGVAYWYSEPSAFSPERPPCFTLHVEEKAWIPDYGWKESP